MLISYFYNNLDIYDYVGKLPKLNFSVWLFSNPEDKILFLLKFNEARISKWNIYIFFLKKINHGITYELPFEIQNLLCSSTSHT